MDDNGLYPVLGGDCPMMIQESATSIVVLGSWNPAILTPEWLLRYAFEHDAGDQVPVLMEFTSIPKNPPILTIDDILITPSETRLVIRPTHSNNNLLDRAELVARRILESLPHTPIAAFGENFKFVEDNPAGNDLEPFRGHDALLDSPQVAQLERKEQSRIDVFQSDNHLIKITRSFSAGQLSVGLNFHYQIVGGTPAKDLITGTLTNNFQTACNLVSGISNVPVDVILGEPHARA